MYYTTQLQLSYFCTLSQTKLPEIVPFTAAHTNIAHPTEVPLPGYCGGEFPGHNDQHEERLIAYKLEAVLKKIHCSYQINLEENQN